MMKKILVMLLACCAVAGLYCAKTKEVTDMAGRKRVLPAEVKKVFSTSPMGTVFMYCLAPDKVAGLSWEVTPLEKRYLLKSFQELPVLGGMFGGKKNTMNFETILKVKPDVILSIGDIDTLAISDADNLESQLGIPVLLIDGTISHIVESYQYLGVLLNEEKRAKVLADYCAEVISECGDVVKNLPADKKVRVYYAEGNDGLETDPSGSRHAEVLDIAGGINVAEVKALRGYGRSSVSVEQLMLWNPELILVCTDQGFSDGSFFEKMAKDPVWQPLAAVKNHQVYEVPYAPFNWFDRPPSTNRIIGIVWLTALLYPEYYHKDIKAETKKFYKLFYHYTLSDAEVNEILAHSVRR